MLRPLTTSLRSALATRWGFVMVLAAVIALFQCTNSISDIDTYWHILMGNDIVTHHRLSGPPGWSLHRNPAWRTTQWGSEVLMAALYKAFGYSGMTVFRFACCGAALITTAISLRATGSSLRAQALVFCCAAFAFCSDLQDRPAALSFAALPLLGYWAWSALHNGTYPRWWLVALTTAVWANFHGYWLLVPILFASLTVCAYLDNRAITAVQIPLRLAAIAAIAALVNPTGWYLYTAFFNIRSAATRLISEWQPTTLLIGAPTAGVLLGIITVYAWARADHDTRPRPAELIFVVGWAVFAMVAYRNVTPAILVVAPTVAARLTLVFPDTAAPPRTRGVRIVSVALAVLAAVGLPALTAATPRQPQWTPTRLYQDLAAEPGHPRVLNYYNLGGQIIAFTHGHARVYIDGRTDFYGGPYLNDYITVTDGDLGWRHIFAQAHPTDVLLPRTAPLIQLLLGQHWKVADTQNGFVLLRPEPAPYRSPR